VTVAVMPREKSSLAGKSLRSLLEHTIEPYDLIYVDAGLPSAVRSEIDALLASREHSLHRYDRYLSPFEANAVAIAAAETEYLVMVDNDVYLRPGWLEAMLRCADEEEADVVAPLVLIGDSDTDTIHAAGGESRIEIDSDGSRRYRDKQFLEWRSLSDSALDLRRRRTELAESHCVLARLETWRALGELDASVGHITNVVELAQGFARIGASMWFEPDAHVVYQFGPTVKFDHDDVRLMNYVWSESWISRDLARMADQYAVEAKRRYWFANQRRCWLRPVEAKVRKFSANLHVPVVGHLIWKSVELMESICNRIYVAWVTRLGWARDAAAVHLRDRAPSH
jgi:GT2 family glycosyltransferase